MLGSFLGEELGAVEMHHGPPSWSTRWRSVVWFVGYLVIGFVIGALTLVMSPAVLAACYAPFASGPRSARTA
jgi:hypothetical protein